MASAMLQMSMRNSSQKKHGSTAETSDSPESPKERVRILAELVQEEPYQPFQERTRKSKKNSMIRLKTAVFGPGSLRDKVTGQFRAPIHPHSPFYKGWEFVSGLLLLYTTAVTPLLIAFFSEREGYCSHPPTIRMDLMVDLFFMLEIGLNFITGKIVVGELITGLSQVASIYLRNGFPVDVLSGCPIAWMEFLLVPDETCEEAAQRSGDNDFIRYLRLIRMLRLLRMLKVLKIFNVLRDLFRMRPTVIRMLKLAFSVCMIAHVGGCAWWFIKLTGSDEQLEEFKKRQFIETPIWSAYLVSVYFQMATLCTVGYGDISADTDGERLLMTFVMLLGASVFAIIISNISAMVASMQSSESLYIEKMDEVMAFLRLYDVSPDLETRVQNFYEFKSRQDTHLSTQKNILAPLPEKLQTEIKMALMSSLLSSVWVFDSVSGDYNFRRSLVPKLEPDLKLPGEKIYSFGEESDYLFIIISGHVNTLVPAADGAPSPAHVIEKFHKGDVLGTLELVTETSRATDCRAVGYVELYKLHKEDWIQLADQFPRLKLRIDTSVARAQDKLTGIVKLEEETKQWIFNPRTTVAHKWAYVANRLYLKSGVDAVNAAMEQSTQRLKRYSLVTHGALIVDGMSFGEALKAIQDGGDNPDRGEEPAFESLNTMRVESSFSNNRDSRVSSSSSQEPAMPDGEVDQAIFMLNELKSGFIEVLRMLKTQDDQDSKQTSNSKIQSPGPQKRRERANVDDTLQKLLSDGTVNAKLLCRTEARLSALTNQWSAIAIKLAERPRVVSSWADGQERSPHEQPNDSASVSRFSDQATSLIGASSSFGKTNGPNGISGVLHAPPPRPEPMVLPAPQRREPPGPKVENTMQSRELMTSSHALPPLFPVQASPAQVESSGVSAGDAGVNQSIKLATSEEAKFSSDDEVQNSRYDNHGGKAPRRYEGELSDASERALKEWEKVTQSRYSAKDKRNRVVNTFEI